MTIPGVLGGALLVAVVAVFVWKTSGVAFAVDFVLYMTVVGSVLFSLLSAVAVGQAPAVVHRTDDGFSYEVRRLAGGWIRPSEVRMRIGDIRLVFASGADVVVLGSAEVATGRPQVVRRFAETILLDHRLAADVGLEAGMVGLGLTSFDRGAISRLGEREKRVGFRLLFTGALALIATVLIGASQGLKATQSTLFAAILVALMALTIAGVGVRIWGEAKAARGLPESA